MILITRLNSGISQTFRIYCKREGGGKERREGGRDRGEREKEAMFGSLLSETDKVDKLSI